jgi:cytochrome c553
MTEDRVAAGALAYSESCATCHGAPGIDRLDWAKGMLPVPPHLSREAEDYTVAQIFWIVDKGIKMSGMPAWQDVMSEEEMWNVAALAKRLPELSASEYQQMLAAAARAEAAAAAGGAAGGGAAAGGEGDGGSAGNGGSGGDAAASASETGATSDKEASAGQ